MITELLHKTLGKEAEQVVEDIAASVIPQAEQAAVKAVTELLPQIQAALVGALEQLVDGRRVVITVTVEKK